MFLFIIISNSAGAEKNLFIIDECENCKIIMNVIPFFTKAMHDFSDAYLGCGVLGNPATGGSGHVICIEIISSPGSKEWDRFSKDVGQEWMSLGGVPHLAKHWDHLPGIYEHIQEVRSKAS